MAVEDIFPMWRLRIKGSKRVEGGSILMVRSFDLVMRHWHCDTVFLPALRKQHWTVSQFGHLHFPARLKMLSVPKAWREMSQPRENGLYFRPISPAIFTNFIADTPQELQQLQFTCDFGDSFISNVCILKRLQCFQTICGSLPYFPVLVHLLCFINQGEYLNIYG